MSDEVEEVTQNFAAHKKVKRQATKAPTKFAADDEEIEDDNQSPVSSPEMEEVTENFAVHKKPKRQATKIVKYNPDEDDELFDDENDEDEEQPANKKGKKPGVKFSAQAEEAHSCEDTDGSPDEVP